MSLCKWGLCIFFWSGWILIGLPIRVRSEVSTDETQPSSAKECRVHIEKALEEYWDKAEPSDSKSSDQILSSTNRKLHFDNSEHRVWKVIKSRHYEDTRNKAEDTNLEDDKLETRYKDLDSNYGKDKKSSYSDSVENDQEKNKIPETKLFSVNGSNEETNTSDIETNLTEDSNENEINSDETEEDEENDDEDDEENDDDEDEENDNEDDEKANEGDEENGNDEDDDDDNDEDEENDNDDEKESELVEDDEVKNVEEDEDDEVSEEEDEDDEDENAEEIKEEEDDDEEENKEEEDDDEEDDEEEESSVNATLGNSNEDQINRSKVVEEKAFAAVEVEHQSKNSSLKEPDASNLKIENLKLTASDNQTNSEIEEPLEEDEPETDSTTTEEDLIENIYEEDDDSDETPGLTFRNRDHIDVILDMDEVGTEIEKEEEKLAQSIFKDIKKIELANIKPMELLYKFADSTSRTLGDAEIFNKPMLLFLGPWSAGKTSIINYILGLEKTPAALKTGTGITDVDFTVLTHGPQRRLVSGTELAADWRYAGVQKFGQGFLDHFRSIHIPHALLNKVTIIDTPGILENRKNTERGYSLNDAFQWFIDRADAIYVVLDPNKVDIGGELGSVVDQLKGRDVRFILNKADTIRRSDLMRVVGQLFWNLSPLMSSTEAPIIYAVSLSTHPFHPSAPTKFLEDQEKNLFYDMKDTLEKRVENKILYARKHAVRVRNHAKMVDCYLATYYRHKSIFSSKRNVAKLIIENPKDYSIYDGLSSMTNVSRYDLPNPVTYTEFFKMHPLYDFKPLASTCSYFRGCPMDKLDLAIAKDIPELLARYKKSKIVLNEIPEEKR